MKFLVKLFLIVVVLFAGCFYFKVVSTDNGIKFMNTEYKTSGAIVEKVIDEGLKLNQPQVNSITYWEIPFINKYYIAYDINFKNLVGGGIEAAGLYVVFQDKETNEAGEDVTLKAFETIKANSSKVESRLNWLIYVFLGLMLVIIVFPTKKKKY